MPAMFCQTTGGPARSEPVASLPGRADPGSGGCRLLPLYRPACQVAATMRKHVRAASLLLLPPSCLLPGYIELLPV